MAWHGMAWHGMAWHGVGGKHLLLFESQTSVFKFLLCIVAYCGLVVGPQSLLFGLFLETCYVVLCFAGSVVIPRECSAPIQEDNNLRLQFIWRSVTNRYGFWAVLPSILYIAVRLYMYMSNKNVKATRQCRKVPLLTRPGIK